MLGFLFTVQSYIVCTILYDLLCMNPVGLSLIGAKGLVHDFSRFSTRFNQLEPEDLFLPTKPFILSELINWHISIGGKITVTESKIVRNSKAVRVSQKY